MGTSDYAPGSVRISFLVITSDGRPVLRPRARVWIASARGARPYSRTEARLEPAGVFAAGGPEDVTALYVGHVPVPKAGTYWILAEPVGGPRRVQGLGMLEVREEARTRAVGQSAIASDTPTLDDVGDDAEKLSTQNPPDPGLLRFSVADSLAQSKPFVLVFATPEFCSSRTCGPVVDVASAARRKYEPKGVRFIHVEIYEELNPGLGTNRYVQEWKLPTEPWVFLVGRDGRIKSKFEGSASMRELSGAIERDLLRG
jgi:hypothetical protein